MLNLNKYIDTKRGPHKTRLIAFRPDPEIYIWLEQLTVQYKVKTVTAMVKYILKALKEEEYLKQR